MELFLNVSQQDAVTECQNNTRQNNINIGFLGTQRRPRCESPGHAECGRNSILYLHRKKI